MSKTEKDALLLEFYKIFKDLLTDLTTTFRDKIGEIVSTNSDYQIILKFQSESVSSILVNHDLETDDIVDYPVEFLNALDNIYTHCKGVFPERFFDILYQNADLFTKSVEFFPQIDFAELYNDVLITDKTRETLWKYLQLTLFTIVQNVDHRDCFGQSAQLFEAINTDEFKNKLQETVEQLGNMFSNIESADDGKEEKEEKNADNADCAKSSDLSSNLDPENLFSHINNLINGKIGSLAKELAEETAKDLDFDVENVKDINDVFKQLFKNPTKLMGLVNNISTKIDKKMKNGSINESELLEEASSIFKNMKSMPGLDQLFKSMPGMAGMPGMPANMGKFNTNAFQNMMDQNIKMSKMKERMNKQRVNRGSEKEKEKEKEKPNNLDEINANLEMLMKQMQNMDVKNEHSFIDDLVKQEQKRSGKTKARGKKM